MAAPFSVTSVSNYNVNPPPDDGSTSPSNQLKWSNHKTKLADPIKTAFDSSESGTLSAFQKMIGGASVSSISTDYTVLAGDQGKLLKVTSSGKTITTPDATVVGSPFTYAVLNLSGGTITVSGNNPGVQQTVDGASTISVPAGRGFLMFTDGSNWFTSGQLGVLAGNQMSAGQIINGTVVESNGGNAVTFSVKTLAGNDPSASDPVLISFRNSTIGTGNYIYRQITSALSLTISSGSTLGFTSGEPSRLWLVVFDDAGTMRLGAINCRSTLGVFPLGRVPIATSVAEGGAGAADAAYVFYTGVAATSKAYSVLAYASYESGLATAGSWNVSPTRLQMYGPAVPLPGDKIQEQFTQTGALAGGSTQIPNDDTIPQNTEGDQYMTIAVTPVSTANILEVYAVGYFAASVGTQLTMALFQDSTANAIAAAQEDMAVNNRVSACPLLWRMLAGTTNTTTMKIRAGLPTGGSVTFNGAGSLRTMGGSFASYIKITEIMS